MGVTAVRLFEARTLAPTPDRTLEQRLEALERANEIRSRRAQLKRDLKAGRVDALDLISNPPGWALTMKILDVLIAMPRVGRVKAGRLLSHAAVAPSKTLGGMTQRQRDDVTERLIWRRW